MQKDESTMSIEGITATLEERGLIWQGSGFALIGAGLDSNSQYVEISCHGQ